MPTSSGSLIAKATSRAMVSAGAHLADVALVRLLDVLLAYMVEELRLDRAGRDDGRADVVGRHFLAETLR